ncbi:Uncharacterised protein [Legionella donaldsonii]|uniref:Uncharacterized protein n=1 Tax=Legionella donaldsonii TaxID=45060 RepID=A0A378J859_9GAMM|nr:hypothetical protein [Legionella donaldsonii]STX43161.1 Uncharacterised protein [Legionella donaldsonii]
MRRYHSILRIDESLDDEGIKKLLHSHPYKLIVKKTNEQFTVFFIIDGQISKQQLNPDDLQSFASEIPKQANQESYNSSLIELLETILKIPALPETDTMVQFKGGWEKILDYLDKKFEGQGDLVNYLTIDKVINTYKNEFNFLYKLAEFLLFNYKKLSDEYKKKNRLPDRIEGVIDKIITLMLNFIEKDPNLLISHNVSSIIVRKILEKTEETNPALFEKILHRYLPKILRNPHNQTAFALKFHSFNHARAELEKTDALELPQECIFAHQGPWPDPDPRIVQVPGNMFQAEKDLELGYTLFLPRNTRPKAILIWVYGGNTANEINTLTGQLADIDLYLLNEGIAVSYLNTPERKLYPAVTVNQLEASKTGQAAVNQTISCYVKQVKENPADLHEKCKVLHGIPVFLIGFSFGGGTVLRYKQLCDDPNIDGFISINGALSLEKIQLHERQIMSNRWTNPAKEAISWLSPEALLRKKETVKPALMVQNIKDTNSNVLNTLSFFKKALKVQIPELKVYLFDDDTNASHDNFDHEIPRRGNRSFVKLAHAICDFILKGDFDKKDSLTLEETKIKMLIYTYNKSLSMRFVSYVYCYYPQDFEQAAEIITAKYEPVLAALYYVNQLFKRRDETLKTTVEADVQRLGESGSAGQYSEHFEKYLTLYLYFSISSSLNFLHYDKIQKFVEMVKNSNEALSCFLTIYEDIDSIVNAQSLHLIENLYICVPSLLPADIYKQEGFLQFKEEALQKFSQVMSKLEHARMSQDTLLSELNFH